MVVTVVFCCRHFFTSVTVPQRRTCSNKTSFTTPLTTWETRAFSVAESLTPLSSGWCGELGGTLALRGLWTMRWISLGISYIYLSNVEQYCFEFMWFTVLLNILGSVIVENCFYSIYGKGKMQLVKTNWPSHSDLVISISCSSEFS